MCELCIKGICNRVAKAIRAISNKTSEVYSAWVLKVWFTNMTYRSWYNYNYASMRLTDNKQRLWEHSLRSNDPSIAR